MKILCTICARKGSKGLRNKNFLKIKKKQLIEYSIDVALKSRLFTDIVVSSDYNFSNNFKNKYKSLKFIKRTEILSKDNIGKVEVIRDALKKTEKSSNQKYDYIIDLDVTSPIRSVRDIRESFKKIIDSNKGNLITIVEARKNPYFNMVFISKNKVELLIKTKNNILRRQDAPKIYEMNASIYIWKKFNLLNDKKLINNNTEYFIMKKISAFDIDDKTDFLFVKNILEKNL